MESTQHPRRNTAEMWSAIGCLRDASMDVWNAARYLDRQKELYESEEEE